MRFGLEFWHKIFFFLDFSVRRWPGHIAQLGPEAVAPVTRGRVRPVVVAAKEEVLAEPEQCGEQCHAPPRPQAAEKKNCFKNLQKKNKKGKFNFKNENRNYLI